jgi:hypothetical protein
MDGEFFVAYCGDATLLDGNFTHIGGKTQLALQSDEIAETFISKNIPRNTELLNEIRESQLEEAVEIAGPITILE